MPWTRGHAGCVAGRAQRALPRHRVICAGSATAHTPRTLPCVLGPSGVEAVLGALDTARDRRCCWADCAAARSSACGRVTSHRASVGLHQRGQRRAPASEPVSAQFFSAVGDYLDPPVEHDQLFVVLREPTRGRPLSTDGLDEILDGAIRKRTGLAKLTCHQLWHPCLTGRGRRAWPLEAVQAQAGHRSIESTRMYIHLANSWLVEQYPEASAAIDAAASAGPSAGRARRPRRPSPAAAGPYGPHDDARARLTTMPPGSSHGAP